MTNERVKVDNAARPFYFQERLHAGETYRSKCDITHAKEEGLYKAREAINNCELRETETSEQHENMRAIRDNPRIRQSTQVPNSLTGHVMITRLSGFPSFRAHMKPSTALALRISRFSLFYCCHMAFIACFKVKMFKTVIYFYELLSQTDIRKLYIQAF
jgi:hypothetical protein